MVKLEHFYHWIEFSPCQSIWPQGIYTWVCFWILCSVVLYVYILHTVLIIVAFLVSLQVTFCRYSNFVFLYQYCFGSFRIFAFCMHFHINFRIRLSVSFPPKKACWDVYWDCTKSRDQFRIINILTVLSSIYNLLLLISVALHNLWNCSKLPSCLLFLMAPRHPLALLSQAK